MPKLRFCDSTHEYVLGDVFTIGRFVRETAAAGLVERRRAVMLVRAAKNRIWPTEDESSRRRVPVGYPNTIGDPRWANPDEVLHELGSVGGRYALARVARAVLSPRISEPKSAGDEQTHSTAATTWIEIDVVDEEGLPLANERYELNLSNGETLSGALDGEGHLRIDAIEEAGRCRLRLPNLDADFQLSTSVGRS